MTVFAWLATALIGAGWRRLAAVWPEALLVLPAPVAAGWGVPAQRTVQMLALAPLSLLLFGQVSLVGLLANPIAIPWVTLVVTPLAMLGLLLSPLWDLAAWAVQGLGSLLAWQGGWSGAALFRPMAPWPLALLGVSGGLLLALRLPWSLRSAGLLMLAPMLAWTPPRPAHGQFEVMAVDVGQGSAVLVRNAGHSLLHDTGPR